VPDGHWRKNLWGMRTDLLRRLRKVAGTAAPHALGFIEGHVAVDVGGTATASAPPPVVSPLPPDLEKAAAAIPDDEVRERFREAAGRYLGRFGRD